MAHLNQLPWTESLFTRRVEQTVLMGKHMTFCRVANESISVVSSVFVYAQAFKSFSFIFYGSLILFLLFFSSLAYSTKLRLLAGWNHSFSKFYCIGEESKPLSISIFHGKSTGCPKFSQPNSSECNGDCAYCNSVRVVFIRSGHGYDARRCEYVRLKLNTASNTSKLENIPHKNCDKEIQRKTKNRFHMQILLFANQSILASNSQFTMCTPVGYKLYHHYRTTFDFSVPFHFNGHSQFA